jgi:hypothetical protein
MIDMRSKLIIPFYKQYKYLMCYYIPEKKMGDQARKATCYIATTFSAYVTQSGNSSSIGAPAQKAH